MTDGLGTIITFYSYKGGTGRSMALANVAWLLACAGKRVLAVDWDFEAPGLHRYFRPFLIDQELANTPGLIDFFWSYATQALTPEEEGDPDHAAWWESLSDLDAFTVQLDWDFPGDGCLDFVPAGQQTSDYADRVTGFDWTKFYRRLNGGALLDALRRRLKQSYDYVLVDSRTGVSDTSGICTVAIPDRLVALCTLNRQSVDGVTAVLGSIRPQRSEVTLFPVVTRVELAEKDRLDSARRRARKAFEPFVPRDRDRGHGADYWNDMEVLYHPYYAYDEVLASFGDLAGDSRSTSSMLTSMERLARRVSGLDTISALVVPEDKRRGVLEQFGGGIPANGHPEFVEDSEQRRVRSTRYLEVDIPDSIQSLKRRARVADLASMLATTVVLASGMVPPLVLAANPRNWSSVGESPKVFMLALSALTLLSKLAEFRYMRSRLQLFALRISTAVMILGNAGLHAWILSVLGPDYPVGPQSGALTPILVVSTCALALFGHVLTTIRGVPERRDLYARAASNLQQEQRKYVNNVDYEGQSSADAWKTFVGRVERILASTEADDEAPPPAGVARAEP